MYTFLLITVCADGLAPCKDIYKEGKNWAYSDKSRSLCYTLCYDRNSSDNLDLLMPSLQATSSHKHPWC